MYTEPEQSAWVEGYEWVGIIYPEDVKPNVTLITPQAFCDQDEIWQAISEGERSEYFPNNGKVACFSKDRSQLKVNWLFGFQPERNQYNPSSESISPTDSRYSRYLIYGELTRVSRSLAQVLNWSSHARDLFAIPDLLYEGIPAEECLSHTIFIRYQSQIYGPIHLEPDLHSAQRLKPREYSQRSNSGGQALLPYGYTFVKDQQIILANWPFIDQKSLGSPVSQTDWSLPQMTIKRVLRASKDVSAELQKKERLVDREINELAALSASNGLEALHLEPCVIQRARYIIQHQMRSLDGLQTLIEELPEEHPLLEQARKLEIQVRKDAIAQACEAEQHHLQALQGEIRSAQEDLAHLNDKMEAMKRKKEQMSADLATQEASLSQRLIEVRQEMMNLLTDLQLTPALPFARFHTSFGETPSEAAQSRGTSTAHPQSYFSAEKLTTLTSPHDLPWGDIAKQNGTRAKMVRASAAALLAGLIPAADDSDIFTVLHAVAQGLAGQRIWHVPVPLTATSPLALFGQIQAAQPAFLPEAGELADILLEAQANPEQLGLVILEGIDRVPFLPVIAPLLRQYRAVRRHIQRFGASTANPEALQLFHSLALAPEDPYQMLSRLTWPANLLLGVTLDEEIGSFPLPESSAPWFARIEYLGSATNNRWLGEQRNWQVSPTSWYAWEKEITDRANSQSIQLMPEDLEPWQQIFYAAMEHFGMKQGLVGIIEQLWPSQE